MLILLALIINPSTCASCSWTSDEILKIPTIKLTSEPEIAVVELSFDLNNLTSHFSNDGASRIIYMKATNGWCDPCDTT